MPEKPETPQEDQQSFLDRVADAHGEDPAGDDAAAAVSDEPCEKTESGAPSQDLAAQDIVAEGESSSPNLVENTASQDASPTQVAAGEAEDEEATAASEDLVQAAASGAPVPDVPSVIVPVPAAELLAAEDLPEGEPDGAEPAAAGEPAAADVAEEATTAEPETEVSPVDPAAAGELEADDVAEEATTAEPETEVSPVATETSDLETLAETSVSAVPVAEDPSTAAQAPEDSLAGETVVFDKVPEVAAAGGDSGHTEDELPTGQAPLLSQLEEIGDVGEASRTASAARIRKIKLIVAGAVVAVLALYTGVAFMLSDRVPRDIKVMGTDIGGMSAANASTALEKIAATMQAKPIAVKAGDTKANIDPKAAGLNVDVKATLGNLTGFSLDPRRLWLHIVGGSDQYVPVINVDDNKLKGAITAATKTLNVKPVDAALSFTPEGKADIKKAITGYTVDEKAAAKQVLTEWFTENRPIVLSAQAHEPVFTQAKLDRFMNDVIKPLTASSLFVQVGSHKIELSPAALAANVVVRTDNKDFSLGWNGPGLVAALHTADPTIGTKPVDARFDMSGDAPKVVPGVDGADINPDTLAKAVDGAKSTPQRLATVDTVPVPPAVTTEYLQSMGIATRIVHFSTPLTSEPQRTENIRVASSKIQGTLIPPGGEFNLLKVIGPIEAANGYVSAGILTRGLHIDALGGGLSQVATQAFNAGFEAGFEDLEHQPHTVWFSRYPAGRESTVFVGAINVRWRNTSPYGALLDAYISGGRVYIDVWSTPYWNVNISSSGPYNFVRTTTQDRSGDPQCEPSPPGEDGFEIVITRVRTDPEGTASTDKLKWRYQPDNGVTCGGGG